MPTANLSVFSGTRARGRCRTKPQQACCKRAGTGANKRAATGAECNHDEHHLKTFEKRRNEMAVKAQFSRELSGFSWLPRDFAASRLST
jgi:hypothetical protein